ncbi:MAG: hypothetical protein AAGJ35_10730, partial [Myxococcota bacterium]
FVVLMYQVLQRSEQSTAVRKLVLASFLHSNKVQVALHPESKDFLSLFPKTEMKIFKKYKTWTEFSVREHTYEEFLALLVFVVLGFLEVTPVGSLVVKMHQLFQQSAGLHKRMMAGKSFTKEWKPLFSDGLETKVQGRLWYHGFVKRLKDSSKEPMVQAQAVEPQDFFGSSDAYSTPHLTGGQIPTAQHTTGEQIPTASLGRMPTFSSDQMPIQYPSGGHFPSESPSLGELSARLSSGFVPTQHTPPPQTHTLPVSKHIPPQVSLHRVPRVSPSTVPVSSHASAPQSTSHAPSDSQVASHASSASSRVTQMSVYEAPTVAHAPPVSTHATRMSAYTAPTIAPIVPKDSDFASPGVGSAHLDRSLSGDSIPTTFSEESLSAHVPLSHQQPLLEGETTIDEAKSSEKRAQKSSGPTPRPALTKRISVLSEPRPLSSDSLASLVGNNGSVVVGGEDSGVAHSLTETDSSELNLSPGYR